MSMYKIPVLTTKIKNKIYEKIFKRTTSSNG